MDNVSTSAARDAGIPKVSYDSPAPGLQVIRTQRGGILEFYLTAVPPAGTRDPMIAARTIYESVAGFLADEEATIFHEKLYSPALLAEVISQERAAALRKRGLQADDNWTLISGRPWEAGRVGGVQIHAITGEPMRMSNTQPLPSEPGSGEDKPVGGGKVLEAAGARYVHLSSVTGHDERGRLPDGGEAQARQMFENARALLKANGSQVSNIVRTWIYLPHILQWYREFNAARTASFERFGIFDESWPGVLPASTGIQGAGATSGQCLMDVVTVEALAGEKLEVTRIHNPRQSEAGSYGSSFSRAVEVTHGGLSQLFISGTASINERSETVYLDDLEGQIIHTMMNVGTLLRMRGAGWEDVCISTAFFKKAEYVPALGRIMRTLGVPRFPVVSVVADVCRHDLLFELEATAVYTAKDAS